MVTVGSKLLYVLGGVAVTVVIARGLGPTGQGLFAVALNLTLMLIQLGSVGLPVANPYFAARDPDAQRVLLGYSLKLAVVLSVVLAGGAGLLKTVVPSSLEGLDWPELGITLATIPVALAALFLQGILLGRRAILAYNLVELSQAATALVALAVGFLAFDLQLAEVLIIIGISRIVSLGVALVALRDVVRSQAPPSRPGLLGQMLRKGGEVYLIALIGFVLIRVDLLLVNALLGARVAGQYSIAAVVAEGLVLVPIVVGTNLLPRVATTSDAALTATVFRTMVVAFGLICLASMPAVAIGVPLLFGEAFQPAVNLYVYLVPGVFSLGLLNSLTVHYFVRGYPRELVATWVLALVCNVIANLLLLEPLGGAVAPTASSLAYGAVLVAHIVVFSRDVGGLAALRPSVRESWGVVAGAVRRTPAPPAGPA